MSTITYNFNPNDTVWCILPQIPSLVRGTITEVLLDVFNNTDMVQETLIRYFVYLPTTAEYLTIEESYIYSSQSAGLAALADLIDSTNCT